MRPWSETVCDWLVDYYALTTVVLVAAVAAIGWLRQPARRLLLARSGVVGLAMLAILAALPGWPRASWLGCPARTQPARPTVVAVSRHDPGIATPLPLAARIEPPRQARARSAPAVGTRRDNRGRGHIETAGCRASRNGVRFDV